MVSPAYAGYITQKSPHLRRVEQLMRKIREHQSDTPKLPSRPTLPDPTILVKQARLIVEEVFELMEACGVELRLDDGQDEAAPLCFKDFCFRAGTPDTLDHIAKEAADVSVVNTGLLVECGILDIPLLEEVDANNLAKFGPGGYLDENHKWRKPPNHPTPDLKRVLRAQGWEQPEVSREEP